jgi:hypothetical protein
MAQRIPNLDINVVFPLLKHNLEETINLQKWCMYNLPVAVGILLPKILSAVGK